LSLDVVRNILNGVLLTAKFNEFASIRVIGHASNPHMRQGIHLVLIRLISNELCFAGVCVSRVASVQVGPYMLRQYRYVTPIQVCEKRRALYRGIKLFEMTILKSRASKFSLENASQAVWMTA
jgi:hypothetical protein